MPKLIISNQTNPYLNIAVENYLLSQPSDGDIAMYLWQNRRTVVIGQNQNPYAECNVAQLEADGGFLMRRRTGGGAVFHDLGNLNFSFVVPYEMYDTIRQFAVLQRAVAAYGLETEVNGRNDVLCQGRKFSGNAFSKGKHQRLHHGTILIRTDVEQLQRYLKVKPANAIQDDKIYCCICGKESLTLTERHLASHNGLTREGYIKLCGYEANQPLMAKKHLERMKANVIKAQQARKAKMKSAAKREKKGKGE